MTEPYENRLSIEQLRCEVRKCWDREHSFTNDIRDLPEIPSRTTMMLLSGGSNPWWGIGKDVQFAHPWDTVPAKYECEVGMGRWKVMRDALMQAIEAGTAKTNGLDSNGRKRGRASDAA